MDRYELHSGQCGVDSRPQSSRSPVFPPLRGIVVQIWYPGFWEDVPHTAPQQMFSGLATDIAMPLKIEVGNTPFMIKCNKTIREALKNSSRLLPFLCTGEGNSPLVL